MCSVMETSIGNNFKPLKIFYDNQQFCDVTIVAGIDGEIIQAHRVVLAASSEFFKNKLMGNESSESLEITSVKGDLLRKIILYCYTGEIEPCIDELEATISIATHLKLQQLITTYCNKLARCLNEDNCFTIAEVAERGMYSDLRLVVEEYLKRNFVQVCQNKRFLELSFSQFKRLLESDSLDVSSEDDVFKVLTLWTNYKLAERSPLFSNLLRLVRLPLLETTCVSDSLDVINTIKNVQPRNSQKKSLVIVARERRKLHNHSSVTILGNHLLMIGGICKFGSAINEVFSIGLETKITKKLAHSLEPRQRYCLVRYKNYIYIMGGSSGRGNLKSVERYDSGRNVWYRVEPMLEKRSMAGAAVLNDKIYVIGGRNTENKFLNTTEYYCPKKNKWFAGPTLNIGRHSMGAAAYNGYLYAVGGSIKGTGTTTVERYDPSAKTWSLICSLTYLHGALKCTVFANQLYALGRNMGVMEVYNPNEEWRHKMTFDGNQDFFILDADNAGLENHLTFHEMCTRACKNITTTYLKM